jgi:ribonuclease P protein component
VLPAANRLRTGRDFARTTKTGVRATSPSLVLYVLARADLPIGPKFGLIVNKSVGGSVTRHRISRQLRHLISPEIASFPTTSQIVIRVLKNRSQYSEELTSLVNQVQQKLQVSS